MEVDPNSTSSNGNAVTPNSLGNVQRPGEYLRQVRVAQQRELQAVSAELNIPLKTLTALEQDNYKVLPEATFIKGYYRTYAKFLNVDASSIIQRFDEIYANDTGQLPNHALNNSPIKIMGKLPGSNRDRNRRWLQRLILAVVFLALIWAAWAMFKAWSSTNDEATADVTEMSDVQILNLDGSNSSNVIPLTGDQLQLDFSAPTSVNITDATGKVLASGRQASSLTLSGEAPFQIRIDNTAVVSLKLNNESVALAKYANNGQADFSLSR